MNGLEWKISTHRNYEKSLMTMIMTLAVNLDSHEMCALPQIENSQTKNARLYILRIESLYSGYHRFKNFCSSKTLIDFSLSCINLFQKQLVHLIKLVRLYTVSVLKKKQKNFFETSLKYPKILPKQYTIAEFEVRNKKGERFFYIRKQCNYSTLPRQFSVVLDHRTSTYGVQQFQWRQEEKYSQRHRWRYIVNDSRF